ncbi:MAG: BamA/TamA family outer membrane protein [Chitinophagales bacterium]|nr:BamA/TamA family outer membrane protein [Chitinophagales bacterium]
MHRESRNYNIYLILIGVFLIFTVSSCSNTKQLAEDQALLVSNKVNVESKEKIVKKREIKDNLNNLPIQEPNKKLLSLFRLKLWFFTVANRKNENKFRYWMKNKVGEPPVIYDPDLRTRSESLMKNYLSNKGHFYNEVTSKVIIKKKKARVTYSVNPNVGYVFDSISYTATNNRILSIIEAKKQSSAIKKGRPFEVDKLKLERDRISNEMQNQGYFYFNKGYVTYKLDSSNTDHSIDVKVEVNPPSDSTAHEVFFIDKVYVYPDYNFQRPVKYQDTTLYKDLIILSNTFRLKPKVLRDVIYLRKGRFYRKMDYSLTVKRLTGLGIFKFVNIRFDNKIVDGKHMLDAYIYMSPSKKQSLGIDLEANSNFEGLLGTGISFTYGNKNMFKIADLFTFNITSGIEVEFNKDVSFINTADISPEITYTLNRFILPFRLKNVSRNANPKTKFTLGYNFQKRVNFYNLQSFNLSFGYEWNEATNKRHVLNPFNVSFLNTTDESQQFLERLEEDPFLKSSFENILILSGNYNYTITSKNKNAKNFLFFRGNLDVGGNILNSIMAVTRADDVEKPYKFLGREYAQYSKIEGDFRVYREIGSNSRLVLRLDAGAGFPYGNSEVLPYVKQFYAGGANSLRAFDVRSVGPGTFADSSLSSGVFGDQTGDMIIEANAEYRFGIFRWMKGALFIDAGNVWLIDNQDKPKGNFSSSFYKEFAVGAGAGVRLDFSFFVIRFDWAIPLREPSRAENDRWVVDKLQFKQFNFNLAIGYPF